MTEVLPWKRPWCNCPGGQFRWWSDKHIPPQVCASFSVSAPLSLWGPAPPTSHGVALRSGPPPPPEPPPRTPLRLRINELECSLECFEVRQLLEVSFDNTKAHQLFPWMDECWISFFPKGIQYDSLGTILVSYKQFSWHQIFVDSGPMADGGTHFLFCIYLFNIHKFVLL